MPYIPILELPAVPSADQDAIYVIRNVGLREGTHKFHRFPGKFIPHIPRWALKHYAPRSRKGVVLDPFCGSGTTLVEAVLAGHRAYGFDVDPIARLVSKVKTTPLRLTSLENCHKTIKEYILTRDDGNFRPAVPTLSHWFTEKAVRDLSCIREAIDLFREDRDLYDFLLIVFASIIRKTSNADNQTQKTYVSHTHKKAPEPAKPLFLYNLEDYTDRILAFGNLAKLMSGKACILEGYDARDFRRGWEKAGLPPADLAITSPPYVKSVDYVYNQMAEYFWIGDLFDLDTQPKQNRFKTRYIGTQRVSLPHCETMPATGLAEIDQLVETVVEKDRKHAHIVARFFCDLKSHFREMASILRPGSHYVMVVGDSVVSGLTIPTHSLLARCALPAGFVQERCFRYEIRNRHMRFPRNGRGGLVKIDWVLDFHLE